MSLREGLHSAGISRPAASRWSGPVLAVATFVALTSGILWIAQVRPQQEHLIFLYFVPTTLIAIRYGSVSAVGMIVASMVAAAYLLYPPRFSLMIASWLDLVELALFSLLALLATLVVSGFANDKDVQRRKPRTAAWRRRLRGRLGAGRA